VAKPATPKPFEAFHELRNPSPISMQRHNGSAMVSAAREVGISLRRCVGAPPGMASDRTGRVVALTRQDFGGIVRVSAAVPGEKRGGNIALGPR
jgi:hypothetical protein